MPSALAATLCAALLLMVTMGVRQSTGLFLSPINSSTGLGIVSLSFALAVGQFMWGAIQPVAGAVADRYGPGRVLAAGLVVLALGCALTPLAGSSFAMTVTLGVLMSAGSGAGSFSVLIGAVSRKLDSAQRGQAAGLINAGGSLGQFVFAPVAQALISAVGWAGAMLALAASSLAALPLARSLRAREPVHDTHASGDGGLGRAVSGALRDRSYLLLHAGFFTCGFHIAFLVTHLPGEVGLCGLPPAVASWSLGLIGLSNIAGSLLTGWAVGRWRSKMILFWMYASRAVLVLIYLASPRTEWTFYLFAVGLGLTWLATVPPTAGVVGKLFGTRYLATLFGLTLLSHQIGGFFGAWLGGIALARSGSYDWMWWADAALAAAAALVNLPIREAPVVRPLPAAT
ncbi:MFS transporter [Methyloversatilis thermotolerans]|uniref:MFS transporter n=1 Tax=Methyloversatilis thermotolerans TaxID=1346290 RepID=UPI000368F10E|nr:MFS transporter [Methyloversatilis thermotolerans]